MSPGLDEDIVARCVKADVPVVPGAVTPTEIMAAERHGLMVTKFFPAARCGGLPAIEALSAPFRDHRFMPTGGVDANNVGQYLASESVIACGGSWMVRPELFAEGDFASVTRLASEAMGIARTARG